MKNMILPVFFAFGIACASAAEQIKFVGTASKYGNAATGDIINPAKWGYGATALSKECDYIVDNDNYCGFGVAGSFPGKSLTLGVVGGNTGNLGATTNDAFEFDFGTLVLNKGTMETKIKATAGLKADITVNAEPKSPYKIHFNGAYNSRINLTGTIQGEGALHIYTGKQDKEYMLARIKSNMEKFSGIVEVGSATASATVTYRAPVLFGDSPIGGEIKVNPCGVVGPCGKGDNLGEFSVGKLTFNGGGAIRIGVDSTTGGTIRVTEKLTLPAEGKVGIDISALPDSCLAGRMHPVLVVPAGSEITENDFEFRIIKGLGASVCGKLVACSLKVETSGENKILYLVMDKYTCLKKDEAWGKSGWLAEYSDNWHGVENGVPLSPDTIYINYYQQMTSPGQACEFGGKKLVVSYNDWGLLFACQEITVPDFVLAYGGQLRFWNQQTAKLSGNITLVNPNSDGFSMTVANARNYTARICSDIKGSGGMKILGSNGRNTEKTDDPSATVYLQGDNSAFSGRIYVTNVKNDPATNMTLRISDAKQLGGAMEKFTYNGLGFANWSRFQADASLELSEPTRGVYFLGGNYVNVPNVAHTLTLASQTTMAGKLVKEGAGTLALGGTVKFTSSQKDEPEAGTNVLHVANGRIMPVSKGGADGLAISFAEGTGLRLSPLGEGDSDVKGYGLYNVKWSAPFNLEETDGKLNVALDMPSNRSEIPGKFSFGVCTVSEAAAESLRDNIELPTVRGYALTVSEECIDEGTVTFKASYCRRGLSVIVK